MSTGERSRSELVALIVAKVNAGALPRLIPSKVWVGKGTERPCYACNEVIATADAEVEIDVASAVVLRLHMSCFQIWQETVDGVTPDPSA